MSQDPASSPLPDCPGTPNCIHQVHAYPVLASELAEIAAAVLEDMGAESVEKGTVDGHALHAVFNIFKYRDDVHVHVMPDQAGSRLFIRSASREGYSDLGVNKRRVRRFLRKLENSLADRQ